jgi:hypothetical protein
MAQKTSRAQWPASPPPPAPQGAVGQVLDGASGGRLSNVETAPPNLGSLSFKHGIGPAQLLP